jgi:hypothetical protein
MKTKHKIILLLLLGWFILFWGIFYLGYFLPIDETKWYSIPYIITSLGLLIWSSIMIINYFNKWR